MPLINLNPPKCCPNCGTSIKFIRIPTSIRQAVHGGWTCKSCGTELDRWGTVIDGASN